MDQVKEGMNLLWCGRCHLHSFFSSEKNFGQEFAALSGLFTTGRSMVILDCFHVCRTSTEGVGMRGGDVQAGLSGRRGDSGH